MKSFTTLTPLVISLFWASTLKAAEEPKFESLRKEESSEIGRHAPVIVVAYSNDLPRRMPEDPHG